MLIKIATENKLSRTDKNSKQLWNVIKSIQGEDKKIEISEILTDKKS